MEWRGSARGGIHQGERNTPQVIQYAALQPSRTLNPRQSNVIPYSPNREGALRIALLQALAYLGLSPELAANLSARMETKEIDEAILERRVAKLERQARGRENIVELPTKFGRSE